MGIIICFEELPLYGTVNLDAGEWKAALGWMPPHSCRNLHPGDQNKLVQDVLAPAEAERYRSFYRNSRRQQELLFTRVLAKGLIRGYLAGNRGFHLNYDKDIVVHHVEQGERRGMPYVSVEGKPVENLSISLAHCGSMLGAAVGEGCLIGIDVEEVRTAEESFLNLFLDHEEILLMNTSFQRLDLHQKSILMWCAKEAVGKAVGTGFSYGFSSIRFRPAGEEGIIKLKLHPELEKYIPASAAQNRIYYDFHEGACCVVCIFAR